MFADVTIAVIAANTSDQKLEKTGGPKQPQITPIPPATKTSNPLLQTLNNVMPTCSLSAWRA
jgi:hypothetical protein